MTKKWTRRGALALMGSGSALVALGSAGFTDVTSNRETNVTTTGDDEALLGIVSGGQTLSGNTFGSEFTVEFTNRTGGTVPEGAFQVTALPEQGSETLSAEDGGGSVTLEGTDGTFTNVDSFGEGDSAHLTLTNHVCEQSITLDVDTENEVSVSIVDLARTTEIDAPESVDPDPDVADFWWPIDEGEGDTIADNEGNQDGTIAGPDWTCGRWIGGWVLEADGEDDYVDTGNWSGFDLNDEFAIAYTVDSGDLSDNAAIMGARDGSGEGFTVHFSDDAAGLDRGAGLSISDGTSEAVAYTNDEVATAGPPHRFVINKRNPEIESGGNDGNGENGETGDEEDEVEANYHDPGEWEIYRDGTQLITQTVDGSPDDPSIQTATRFFERGDDDHRLAGKLDDVIVFSRPLGDDEIGDDFERQPWTDVFEFEVTIVETNDPVVEGETLEVVVEIENVGDGENTQTIGLFYDDTGDGSAETLVDTQDVTLDAGDSTEITLEWETGAGDAGENVAIRVASATDEDTDTVEILDGTFFAVSEFDAPETALRGTTIEVSATVTNEGDVSGIQTVEYRFDDEQEGTQEVELDPDEDTTVTFEFEIPDQASGTYTHGIHSDDDSDEDEIEIESMADKIEVDENAAWSFDTALGQSGVAFDVTNTSTSRAIVVTEVGVDDGNDGTGNNPNLIAYVRDDEDDEGEFGILEERQSNTDFERSLLDLEGESIEVEEDNPVELDENLELGPGETEPVGFNQYRDEDDDVVNMNHGDTTIRLVFEDGSVAILAFEDIANQPSN